jgi:FkbM family methyltransferase
LISLKQFLRLPLTAAERVAWRERLAFGRFYTYLGPDLALTQLWDGQFIYVDPQDEQISHQIIARGYWEPETEVAVRRMVRKGDRIVEVGANIGYYTLLMARMVGPQGRIDSFEANPRLASLLRRSVTLNDHAGHVTVHAKAAGISSDPVSFVVSRNHAGSGHVQVGDAPAGAETVMVEAIRLDEAVEGPVDFIRMDAEGYEPLVVLGGADLVIRSPTVKICMEWDRVQMSPRADVAAWVSGMAEHGFSAWVIRKDSSLQAVSAQELLKLPHTNVVFARSQPF